MIPERQHSLEGTDFHFEQKLGVSPEIKANQNDLIEMSFQEQEELPVVDKNNPKMSRLRRAVTAITIGLVLALSTPELAHAQKLDPAEKVRIETQMKELQDRLDANNKAEASEMAIQRRQELNEWIKRFNLLGLRIGDPEITLRTPAEQVGVYFIQGKSPEQHLGDICAKGGMKITKSQLI